MKKSCRFVAVHVSMMIALNLFVWTTAQAKESKRPNALAEFLNKAELAKEAHRNRGAIREVLRDLSHEEPGDVDWLRRRRYNDDQGNREQWSAFTVLRHSFVSPVSLNEKTFYADVEEPDAQEAARLWIRRLLAAPSAISVTCPRVKASETLQAPAGWELQPGAAERFPQHVTLFNGHPSKRVALKPFNGDETSDFYYWRDLDPKATYWMTCGYGAGSPELMKALSAGLSYCETSREPELRLACYSKL